MQNSTHIEKLHSCIKQGSEIKEIHLMGYASPEGPYSFNEALAAKRAEAVKKHLEESNIPASIKLTTHSSPADWTAVKKMLKESYIENYQHIIAIIDDTTIALEDKNRVIKEKYPVAYDFMLRVWYPELRKTEITFAGNKKQMSIEEAKAQLQKDPKQLSLEDIYMVALIYEKGSKEWEDIIIIAVDTYPQSPEARINAANVAMANGNYQQAAAYLNGVPANIPQAMNSRGILAMAEGKYQDAMQLFQAAEKAGVSEAAQNIALLKELMEAEN
jgi:predicted Zn-dependent protease